MIRANTRKVRLRAGGLLAFFACAGLIAPVVQAACVGTHSTGSDRVVDCGSGFSILIVGIASFLSFRAFDTFDLWMGPTTHNDRYRKLRAREQEARPAPEVTLLAPTRDSLALGYQLRF